MKYRVVSAVKLDGRWYKPGETVKGDYESWVGRGDLAKAGETAKTLETSSDVSVTMGRPVSEYVEDVPLTLEDPADEYSEGNDEDEY